MKFDIVFVTYNSQKWLENNIQSILKSDYDLKNISLYYYDNNSTDNTIEILNDIKNNYANTFNEIEIIKGKKNLGFGVANNKAAKLGNSEYIFFLNVDTEVDKDTFKKLSLNIKNSDEEFAVFELRQKPYEHPKYYDPVTQETTWASGACMVLKRSVFNETGGFDKNLFMYCEDTELSWNIRKRGYKIKYLYDTPITHYSYSNPDEIKEMQFISAFINNLYLRCKYGSLRNYIKGHLICLKSFKYNMAPNKLTNEEYKKIRNKMVKYYIKNCFKRITTFIKSRFTKNVGNFEPTFVWDLNYEVVKLDPFYVIDEEYKTDALVSIIVRTCGRPDMLRETLISLRKQSYKNIEIVIVEDGENISEEMIKKEFSDLNIVYEATKEKVGRSKVGNIAMKKAKGKYLNFLDDDDLFFPEHVEVLVKELEKNNVDIVYSTAFETAINILSKSPYKYEICAKGVRYSGKFSKIGLYKNNITPIQAVMFKKTVFEKCGGFDESIDALEDWDLWLNFSLEYPFYHIEKTTSIYRVPFNNVISKERQKFLDSSLDYLTKKHANDNIKLSPFDIFWDNVKKDGE